MSFTDSAGKGEWSRLYAVNHSAVLKEQTTSDNRIPDMRGMGLKDAIYLLENMNVKVVARGKGKVKTQSIIAGSSFTKNQTIVLDLN
jgi:cell division protein FtsI (penicillin-binding protein 3)